MPERTAHWTARWSAIPGSPRWIWGEFVYHEAVGVEVDASIRVWDPTDNSWLDPATLTEHGTVMAMRVLPASHHASSSPATLEWGTCKLPLGYWAVIP